MTVWRVLALLAIGAAVIAGGTTAAFSAAWLLSRIGRRWGLDPTPMGTTRQTYPAVSREEADAIRAQADQRRVDAEARHAEGRSIETGQPRSVGEMSAPPAERSRLMLAEDDGAPLHHVH